MLCFYVFMFRWILPAFFLLARSGRKTDGHNKHTYVYWVFYVFLCLQARLSHEPKLLSKLWYFPQFAPSAAHMFLLMF
jgi:hypothetical protein